MPHAFRALTLALLLVGAFLAPASTRAATYGHSAIVTRDGYPVFTVDDKPFFVYGAAFFYERLPRDMWRSSMLRLRALGVNTLDLYVPWNWHELGDGDFDFTGRTSPRRDLHEVMRLARELGFAIILRPGPVIRNEWRNGGYPAWLLKRPEYGMPLHDLLEGRYPPTATLQNARSDDAAAQWMANATHARYARRWLRRVLHEFEPVADRVIAVQLDDDQGAYIDNQTWPAPHLRAYLQWLADVVHGVTGPAQPVFINTYDMKVTASSPVWAMGNWYQSDTYAIGEHDRAQLELATGLLQTQIDMPLMLSEFQAGWLEGPGEIHPRPADPSNTELAMGTLLGMGVRGIVNFPAQDTLYPSGMEAPFANAFYAWDAALALDGTPSPRAAPTRRMGELISAYGSQLAQAHLTADAAIAYLTSALAAQTPDNQTIAQIAARTSQAQRSCRALSLSCVLTDLRFIPGEELQRYPLLILPTLPQGQRLSSEILRRLRRYERGGGVVLNASPTLDAASVEAALRAARHERVVASVPGASFAAAASNARLAGFLSIPNYGDQALHYSAVVLHPNDQTRIVVRDVTVAARSSLTAPIARDGSILPIPSLPALEPPLVSAENSLPIRRDQRLPGVPTTSVLPGTARAFAADLYREGSDAIVLQNALVRVVIAPDAGARAFAFEDLSKHTSVFTTVGALRDDVQIEPPLSTTDKIAAYTHQFPAGTFNRSYRAEITSADAQSRAGAARAVFSYDAPDVLPHGARFEKSVSLAPDARAITVDETASFMGNELFGQRAVSVSSLTVGEDGKADAVLIKRANAIGLYDRVSGELATISWRPGDVEEAKLTEQAHSVTARLTLAPNKAARMWYGYDTARDLQEAQRMMGGNPGGP